MIVHRGKPWAIVAIITLSLTAIVSGSTKSDKSSATRKLSPRLTRSVINDGLFDNKLTPHCATCNRVEDVYNNSVWAHWGNLEPNRSYSKYPKSYQRHMLWNSPRYKRHLEFSETRLPNVSESSQNGTKDTLIRIPLYRLRGTSQATRMTHQEDPVSSTSQSNDRARERRSSRAHSALRDSPSGRTRRSSTAGDDQPSRRNSNDYYAERRAVMARFYARQREIEARFGNRTKASPQPANAATSNITLFRLYPSRNSTDDRATFRHPSITIDPVYNPNLKPAGQPVVQEVDRRRFQSRNNGDVKGQVALDYTTSASCSNASLSGTFALKKRSKTANNYTESVNNERHVHTTVVGRTSSESNGTEHEIWGECKGKVVYQHNLLLGLKGPSILDTVFEVIIQGPVCITCVEALRYNETRAKVKFESGGRGHDYVKLKLQGYENEGFSYIIKVWGVKKIDPDCKNV